MAISPSLIPRFLRSLNTFKTSACLALFISFFGANICFGQGYIDNGWEYAVFRNEGGFNSDPIQHRYRLTIGCILFQKEDRLFHMGLDFTNFSRIFNRQISGDSFEYSFRGLEFKVYGGVTPFSKMKIESGVSFAVFGSGFEINGEPERIGEGFSSHDVGVVLRSYYYLHPNIALGVASTRWFNPMLQFEPIGDFGELRAEEKWIETATYTVFLRYQFGNHIIK